MSATPKNKFVAGLKPKAAVIEAAAPPETDEQEVGVVDRPVSPRATRPSRRNTKHIGGYFDPAVSKQLREIALEEDSSVQALMGEAIDMLFQSRRKPTIARKASA